jgi:hypothetical protein
VLISLPACDWAGPASAGSSAARDKGRREANETAAAGTLRLREYPPTPASAQHGEYIDLLKEKGIGYQVLSLPAGVADADFRAEIAGWNEVMQAEITKKFGPTVLADLLEEANKRWEERVKNRK